MNSRIRYEVRGGIRSDGTTRRNRISNSYRRCAGTARGSRHAHSSDRHTGNELASVVCDTHNRDCVWCSRNGQQRERRLGHCTRRYVNRIGSRFGVLPARTSKRRDQCTRSRSGFLALGATSRCRSRCCAAGLSRQPQGQVGIESQPQSKHSYCADMVKALRCCSSTSGHCLSRRLDRRETGLASRARWRWWNWITSAALVRIGRRRWRIRPARLVTVRHGYAASSCFRMTKARHERKRA